MNVFVKIGVLIFFVFFADGSSTRAVDMNKCTVGNNLLVCREIPKHIPDGIIKVILKDFETEDGWIREGTFTDKSWKRVKYLEITFARDVPDENVIKHPLKGLGKACFVGLDNLEELHIHANTLKNLELQSLDGLVNLNVLDFSDCGRLGKELFVVLNSTNSVPNIDELILARVNTVYDGISLDKSFFAVVSKKNISVLDVSANLIKTLDLTFTSLTCGSLRVLNMSYSTIVDIESDLYSVYGTLEVLDLSYSILPPTTVGTIGHILNATNQTEHIPLWHFIVNINVINVTGIAPKDSEFVTDNVQVFLIALYDVKVKALYAADNNIVRCDIHIKANFQPTLEILDLSSNGLRYFNPETISFSHTLRKLYFANNDLNKMMQENETEFGQLLTSLTNLTHIDLSRNKLADIPNIMFYGNKLLLEINLSNNRLKQITFKLDQLIDLEYLNLFGNQIQILNSNSITILENVYISQTNSRRFILKTGDNTTLSRVNVNMGNNMFLCSHCESLDFIKWLTSTSLIIKDKNLLECSTEDGGHTFVTQDTVSDIQAICKRTIIIVLSTTLPILIIIGVIVAAFVAVRYRRKKLYKHDLEEQLELIQTEEHDYKYVVFLSFSSDDAEFVYDNVLGQLRAHLQRKTSCIRDIVCVGDTHFRLGYPIYEEVLRCLEMSAVFITVVSSNFCSSSHCRNEVDFAFQLEKPTILMFKETVQEDEMTGVLRLLFQKYTRILWTKKNDTYELKTSWENVCDSILELMSKNK